MKTSYELGPKMNIVSKSKIEQDYIWQGDC